MTTSRGRFSPRPGPSTTRRRLVLLAALDVAAICFGVAAFLSASDPDIPLHVVWVILAIEAFVFGFRTTLVRIGLATIGVVIVAANGSVGRVAPFESLQQVAFSEWPLMVVISLIVAVMADRVTGTSRHYAHLYREASDRLLTAQEVERRRLSRDLHDGVGQTLTALLFTLDATESSQWSGSAAPALTTNGIHRAQELAAIALEETRDVATRLRPTRIVEAGVCASIVELAQRTSPAITVDVPPDLIRTGLLPQDAEIDLFRIVQEALANATRHARAQHIGVSISRTGDDLRVEISDDGVGFGLPTAKDEGLGLAGMRERADSIRGRLSITSGASGSTVAIVVALATDPRPRLDPSTSAAQPVSAHEVRT